MKRWFLMGGAVLATAWLVAACSTGGLIRNDGGFPDGGVGGGGGGAQQFGLVDLDTNTRGVGYIAAAFDPALERVGVAYMVQVDAFGTQADGGGSMYAADGG